MKKDLTISIVNYKSQKYLKKCVVSIFEKLGDFNYEIVIVNNDQEKINFAGFNNEKIKIIELNKNIGFGRAHNKAVKSSNATYVWFLNPDTEILSDNFNEVIDFLNQNQKVGILGMRLLGAGGEVQSWLAGKEISLIRIIKNNLGLIEDKKIWKANSFCEVDWVSGGAMIVRRNLFNKLKGFDDNYFLYFEDIDLCKRAQDDAKQKIIYFPLFKVKHFCGGSSVSNLSQKKYYYISQDYYFRKFHGAFKAFILKLIRKIELTLNKRGCNF